MPQVSEQVSALLYKLVLYIFECFRQLILTFLEKTRFVSIKKTIYELFMFF